MVRMALHVASQEFGLNSNIITNKQPCSDILKLSLLMGHEKVETTQVYLRTIQSRQARQGKSVIDELGVK